MSSGSVINVISWGFSFIAKNGVSPGGPDVPLTPPDQHAIKHIELDGNTAFFAQFVTF